VGRGTAAGRRYVWVGRRDGDGNALRAWGQRGVAAHD
jgi:hypothetical protein